MDDLLNQIDSWHQTFQHKKIIKAIEKVPEKERGYELTGLLARALMNSGEGRESLRLLESISDQGSEDWVWFFRMGVVLVLLECGHEADGYLRRCLALGGPVEDVNTVLEQAHENIAARHAHVEEVVALVGANGDDGWVTENGIPPSPRVVHTLFTADEDSARTAAARIEKNGYTFISVESARTAGFRGVGRRAWVVVAAHRDVAVTPEYLYTTRAFFESLAIRIPGGVYDGWEADRPQ